MRFVSNRLVLFTNRFKVQLKLLKMMKMPTFPLARLNHHNPSPHHKRTNHNKNASNHLNTIPIFINDYGKRLHYLDTQSNKSSFVFTLASFPLIQGNCVPTKHLLLKSMENCCHHSQVKFWKRCN